MDYNAQFHHSLRLDDAKTIMHHSQALDWLLEIFDPNPALPESVVEIIVQKHLNSQPIRRLFELRVLSKNFQAALTGPKFLNVRPIHESWMLKQSCVWRNGSIVSVDMYDVLQKKRQLIPIPTDIALRRDDRLGLSSRHEFRVSSSQGGESGLIYLEKEDGASTANIRECFVFNPMTKSVRQLHLHKSVQQIDRIRSRYLSWASTLGGEEMRPSLLDPLTGKWNQIGFTARGHIRKEKAVMNEVVYLRYRRYHGRRRDLMNQLIIYDMRQETFREESTTGLPNNMVDEYLFHHEGHIYLAAVLFFPSVAGDKAWKEVVLYELQSTNSPLNWEIVSEITDILLDKLTADTYPALSELKFFYMDHELLVASLVTKRKSDGARVSLHGARSPCHAIAAFDLNSHTWREDRASRLGPELHADSTVFMPRLDIEA